MKDSSRSAAPSVSPAAARAVGSLRRALAWGREGAIAGAHRFCVWRQGRLYRGSPADLFVVSYPKSGTTLGRMLLYQLLTPGGWDFANFEAVSPTVERCLRSGVALESLPHPRILKSHLSYGLMPKGPGRYIYMMRSGLDIAASLYYHGLNFGNERRTFERFFYDDFLAGRLYYGSWFRHVARWKANARGLRVLYVTFEDLKLDFHGSARRVAEFVGVNVAAADWPRIAANCSFATMREHERQLEPSPAPGMKGGARLQVTVTPRMRAAYEKALTSHPPVDELLRPSRSSRADRAESPAALAP